MNLVLVSPSPWMKQISEWTGGALGSGAKSIARQQVFEDYKRIAKGLSLFFGPTFEAVVYDFASPEHAIVAIEGNVTGRSLGGPVTEFVVRLVRTGEARENVVNNSVLTPEGKPLKTAIFFIRDNSGEPMGALAFYYDLTHALMEKQSLDTFLQFASRRPEEKKTDPFSKEFKDTLDAILQDALAHAGKPVHLMKKKDKLQFTREVEARGLFLFKGAIERLAEALHVTKFTIYNYLKELKREAA